MDRRINLKDDDISLQVGAGLGAVGAAVLGPVVQVSNKSRFKKKHNREAKLLFLGGP